MLTPYLVGKDYANLGPKVFFVWGSLCTCALVWGYYLVPETKGLSLEQIDKMMRETRPRDSGKWRPEVAAEGKDGDYELPNKSQIVEVEGVESV